ncbi:Golgi apparatus protein 1 isoform X2 [Nematostella vectensis]|uniref:Golgi apparatus protein 1 isoform X2 n=1 Tax=Nematostella vectensis TaxID=45351 RepID=UPI00138FE511|nr:Golgi apparatus protein 1 isoform X2 [Nematostella vectensis]
MAHEVGLFSLLSFLFILALVVAAPPKKKPTDGSGPALNLNAHQVNLDQAGGNAGHDHLANKVHKQPEKTNINRQEDKRPHKRPKEKDLNAGVIQLGEHPDCADDVQRLCHEVPKGNNFAILVCIQDKAVEDEISNECHNLLWHYKKNLTCDERFEKAAQQMCASDLQRLPYCQSQLEKYPGQGKLVPCLLEHRQNVTDTRCKHMMTKMQAIVFSNYHLIDGFFKECQADVERTKCGRIEEKEEDEDVHTQNAVIECLEKHVEDKQVQLSPKCKKQIYRMAELSADDYHLDRPLYYACRDDREKFCLETPAGEGRVYKCLAKHKFEKMMSPECQEMLTVRQQIVSHDVKADYGLLTSCQKDFLKYKDQYHCDEAAEGKTMHGGLAVMILCLEKAITDGNKVSEKCQSELFETRQQLMEDYSINPEIVSECDQEIDQHCKHGTEKEGKTLDCLMRLAEEGEGKIRARCTKALHNLVKETGAGGDYRIDHTLYMACEPVVQTACKDKGKKEGDVMVLSCLMEHLNTDAMNHECREQLLHLQFFIARDFSLDPALYKACKNDAHNVCHAKSFSEDSDEVPNGMIVSCLYRNSFEGSPSKISDDCSSHVRRVMHQRALDVHLIPEVQEGCMRDLGQHCSANIEKGQEVECLQTNLEKLSEKCRAVIRNFTEQEGEDYQLDQTLVRMCSAMVPKFCEEVITKGDSEGVLPCLIEHKNDVGMDDKCRASIHHWQLIEMKDFTFSSKFKKACRKDVEKHCPNAETKHAVVKCLSEKVRNAVINDKSHVISEKCRGELRIAETEEGENIKFNPELYGACNVDVETHCKGIKEGQAQVLECLKDNFDILTTECQKQLFAKEETEVEDPEIDFQLIKSCQSTIQHLCSDVDPKDLLRCLEKHKRNPQMTKKCREIVLKRQKKQYEDYKLDPELQSACKREIKKFCFNHITKDISQRDGEMVNCLKKQLPKENLGQSCEMYIRTVIHEEAMDYRLDPKLSKACKDEVSQYCQHIEPGHGKVEECLRNKLEKLKKDGKCYVEVIRTMREGKTDVYADPVLFDACINDIKHLCEDVDPGHGRVMNCLIGVKASKKNRLSNKCNLQLKARLIMWDYANIQSPESFSDLAAAITLSPSKNYFFMVFAIALSLIFVGGLVFGRISKRVKREIKDR